MKEDDNYQLEDKLDSIKSKDLGANQEVLQRLLGSLTRSLEMLQVSEKNLGECQKK